MSDPSDQTETLPGTPLPPQVQDGARPPRILGDRYRLDQLVASGGMASVWRAHDAVLARSVAVKLLHDHLGADEDFRERFRREAVAAARLSHPNAVGMYDTGTDGEQVYLVMEFVEGVTLRDVIADEGRLASAHAASVGEQVARALEAAHLRGLVHRDVKPANILVGTDGRVKVADFGIAKAEEAGEDLTRTGMVLGTAAYVAPEQILGEPIDGSADQYALGCVLYEALSGEQAFKGDSAVATAAQRLESDATPLRELVPDVPPGLADVVERAMARRPEDRYPSAGALADALAVFTAAGSTAIAASDDVGATAAMPQQTAPGQREDEGAATRRRRRSVVPVLLGLGLLLALTFGVVALLGDRAPSETDASPSAPEPAAEEPAAVEVVAPAAVELFDPEGGDSEQRNAGDLDNLLDDDPATTWQSVGYNTPDFGGLKDGLGFVLDLGAPHEVTAVTLEVDTPGVSVDLRSADAPAATAAEWEVIAGSDSAAASQELAPEEPVTTQYLLVYVTGNLQPEGGRNRVRLAGVTVQGRAV